MEGIIEIGLMQLVIAYIFLVLLLFIVRRQGIGREKEILIASLRMTVQLVLVGYVLAFVLEANHFIYALLSLVIMEFFAIANIFSRLDSQVPPHLKRVIVFSMLAGTSFSILFFLLIVINLNPWYDARYFIPITGMVIGNSMTGITLGVDRLLDGIKSKRALVEGALMLGAQPDVAVRTIVNDAFASAILPTINSMVGMGIVFLPGMMTGQIIAGVSPTTAISYQIAIMMAILGSVSLTSYLLVRYGSRTFFNARSQLTRVNIVS